MPWFRVDDGFHNHPKVLKAGTAAVGLYVRCGSYSAQQLTDGFVPSEVAAQYGSPEWARRLVDVGLWVTVDGGYRMPDFLEYNPSRAKVLAEREQKAKRQQRWREGQKGRRVTGASTNASTTPSRDASPSRPPLKGEGGARASPTDPVDNSCTHGADKPSLCAFCRHGLHAVEDTA